MTKGNLAIAKHKDRGEALMLFESVEAERVRFIGFMDYVTRMEKRIRDRTGKERIRSFFAYENESAVSVLSNLAMLSPEGNL